MKKISRLYGVIKAGFALIMVSKNFHIPLLAYTGFTKREKVIVDLRTGAKIICRPKGGDLSVIVDIYHNDCYNFTKFEKGIVIDVGAHIGVFTILASKYAERVYAYEPHPENFQILEKNIQLNSLDNVQAYQMAVAANKGEGDFYVSERSTEAHSIFPFETEKIIKVRETTLKNIFDEREINRVSFLKIDCEGCEYEILANLPEHYFERIEEIALDSHHGYSSKIEEILRNNNFKVISEGEIIHGFKQE